MTDGIKESPESTHLCPVYYAGSGKGYSGQPEKGDLQYLYFPTGQDKDRYVIGSVDVGAEKMEQLERREKDESAGEVPKAQAAEAELPDTKSWSTPGNRRMVLSRGGVSFANSRSGRLSVNGGGICIWTNGNMSLEAEEIAGEGQKITVEEGDYAWLGSGTSGMLLLPDQIQLSAVDVYMESPLNWIHKIIDEETTETLLNLYEEMKAAVPPITAPDGTVIRRDGYDDILYSEELYDYFLNNVVGKAEGYERNHDEPYVTLYEQWLDEVYGHAAMWYFWNYVFSIDGLQTMLDIGGFFFDGCDLVNAAIYLLRGKQEQALWSLVAAVPFVGSLVLAKKGKKLASAVEGIASVVKADDVVTDLILTYRAEERSMDLLTEIGPVTEKMLSDMSHSSGSWGISQDIFFKNLSVTTKLVNNAGEVTDVVKIGEGGTVPDFYVGSNGKALPGQYKDWIGTNMQKELLNQTKNPQLQNAIKQLYRGNSFIGDGGTADVIRFEQQTGLMLGKNGGSHVQNGIDMAKYIENKILTQDLCPSDRALATQLLEDLYSALGR